MSIQREVRIVVGRPRSAFSEIFDVDAYNLDVYYCPDIGEEFVGYAVESGVSPCEGWCAGLRGTVEAFEVQTGMQAVVMPCVCEY